MKHFTAYVAAAAAVTMLPSTEAVGGCSTAAWYAHEDELQCIPTATFNATAQILEMFNAQSDNLNLGDTFALPSYQFSMDEYTYSFAIDTTSIQLSAVNEVDFTFVNVSSGLELTGNAVVQGDLEINVQLRATLSQVSNGMCRDDEEVYLGLCYKQCALLNPDYPLRTATNTCSMNGCDADQELDAGLCYAQCKPGWTGVLSTCWGSCPSGYTDMGLYCYQWWPPATASKNPYDRGAGRLPYLPDTQGLGCNGYGVDDQGGCAQVQAKHCYGQPTSAFSLWNIIFAPDTPCPDITMQFDGKLSIKNLVAAITGEVAVNACDNPIDFNNPACNRARPGDYLAQFASPAFGPAQQAAFNRVQDLRVTNVSLADLSRASFSLALTNDGGAPQEFQDYATNKASCIITQAGVVSAVQSTLEGNLESTINQVIQAELSPFFGTACPDCDTCALDSTPPNLRCASGGGSGRLLSALLQGQHTEL